MPRDTGFSLRVLVVAVAAAVIAPTLRAQSITSGTLAATIVDEVGQPLNGARAVISEPDGGFSRVAESDRRGRVQFLFVQPGRYELFVEQLGFRPVRVRGIAILPGRHTEVSATLVATAPPVFEVDEVRFPSGVTAASRPGSEQWFRQLELTRLPEEGREIYELGRFSSVANEHLEIEGLPHRFSALAVDGVMYVGATHPGLPQALFPAAAFPRSAFQQVALLTGGLDVEWSGVTSGLLSGYMRRGSGRLEAHGFADWIGQRLTRSKFFDPEDVGHNTFRGGLLLTGPIIPDTARFVLGVEAQRLETVMPRAWTATALDSALMAVASDTFGVDLSAYLEPRLVATDVITAFGRFDRRIGDAHLLSVRANAATLSADNVDLGAFRVPQIDARLDGTDVSAAATLTSQLGRSVALELRAGFQLSSREFGQTQLPGTALVDGPLALGADAALPARFQRVAFHASETLHFQAGSHWLKLGGAATVASLDHTFAIGRGGSEDYAGVDEFAQLDGTYVQSVGALPLAKFTSSQFGGFLQDRWRLGPGMDVTAGLRVDVEVLPDDDVPPNDRLREVTGLANNDIDRAKWKFAPRFGFNWDLGNLHTWLVHGEAGVYHGVVDPGILAELITQSGAVEARRGIGILGPWPDAPDSVAAPVVGPALTLLGPDFQAPRSVRAAFGISHQLDAATALHLTAAYRRTDFLPRRHDLNLLPAPTGRDQHGRPLYGELRQQGSILTVTPQSNRRFTDFDVVSVLDPDGSSDYWGVTARLERRLGRLVNLIASYTYSRTEDNWLGGRGGGPDVDLTPFPDSLGGRDWAKGRSDFDVPHRVVAGAEIELGPVRLAGYYRYRSGYPFTPGFRDGVDVNGDGAAGNDPAFVADALPGVAELIAEWDCLRAHVGRFVERNACRAPGLQSLDLRLSVTPIKIGRYPFTLVVEGLNLLEADVADRDRALYLVDATGALTTDPVTGDVVVPLVANAGFGRPIVRRTTGRVVRLGVRLNYE